jgi:hypothetical protein
MRRPFSLAFEIPSGVVLIVTAVQAALRHRWPVAWMVCIGIGLLLMGILVAFHGLRKDRDAEVKKLNDEITGLWGSPVLVQRATTPRAAAVDNGTGTRIPGALGVGHETFIHSEGEGGAYSGIASIAPDSSPQGASVAAMSALDLVADTMQFVSDIRGFCVSHPDIASPRWNPSRPKEETDAEHAEYLARLEECFDQERTEMSSLFAGRSRAIAVQFQIRGMLTPSVVERMVWQCEAKIQALDLAGRLESLARGLSPESFRSQCGPSSSR